MDFAAGFSPCFRTETHHGAAHARAYLCGLLQGARGRKNIERMEELVPDLNYQGVQQFISDSPWEASRLMTEVARQADGFLGGVSDSRLILDGSDFSKKGEKSVGVARQYNGNRGKLDNCQAAVFAALSAGHLVTPVGVRLYLPQEWCGEAARCEEAGIPEGARIFRTKTQLGLDLVVEARDRGVRHRMVCADGGFGKDPAFLRGLDDSGEDFVIEVHCDQRLYRDVPWPEALSAGGAPVRSRRQQGGQAVRVDEWVRRQPESAWERLKIRDSTRGWVEVNFVAERVWLWDGREDAPRLWWGLAWQNPDEGPAGRIHYALSNAAATADPRELVRHGVHRYWIERVFQDAKSEAGMADYQTRGWRGWHHHMALVALAMFFLLKEKVLHAATTTELALTTGEIVFALSLLLPQRVRDFEATCDMVEARRRKRWTDQLRRQRKTAIARPPLLPLET